MKDLTLLAGRDWLGARVQPGDVPSLSHFVERALQFEASGDAAARAALLCEWARQGWPAARMARELIDGAEVALGPERLAADIRRLRRRVIASLIVRDATGACGLPEVVSTTTALAELALKRAVAVHARELAQLHGVPTSAGGVPQDLLVIGMGKLGGGELNVSSDIDLTFVYDEDGETRPVAGSGDGRPLSNHEFFIRLGRRVIPAISDVTGDELQRLTAHLAERLTGLHDGQPKVFRDSAVENLRDFFERFRRVNIRSSPELDSLVEQAQQTITGIEPQTLRDSYRLRQLVARDFEQIQAAVGDLLVDRPRRNILRRGGVGGAV